MRFLIVVALVVAVACAAPLHDEPELDGSGPSVEVSEKDKEGVSPTSKKEDAATETENSEHDSEEIKDDQEQNELENEETEYDEQPDGVEMIALFAIKVQPAYQSSLFDYPMALPFGVFQRPNKYLMYDRMHHGALDALGSKKY